MLDFPVIFPRSLVPISPFSVIKRWKGGKEEGDRINKNRHTERGEKHKRERIRREKLKENLFENWRRVRFNPMPWFRVVSFELFSFREVSFVSLEILIDIYPYAVYGSILIHFHALFIHWFRSNYMIMIPSLLRFQLNKHMIWSLFLMWFLFE